VEAEGCFYIGVASTTATTLGYRIQLTFKITQHSRDDFLMGSLVKYLGCGNTYLKSSVDVLDYEVKKVSDLNEKIIPLFRKYPLQGSKKENFEDFCKAVSLIKSGAHLTESGLEEIRRIKSGMNTQRKHL
jgi:LAGLIDADG endonuclease